MDEFSIYGADILKDGDSAVYMLEYQRYTERLEAMSNQQEIKRSASNQPYPSDGNPE